MAAAGDTVGFTTINDAIDHIFETFPAATPISFGRMQVTHIVFQNRVTMSIAMHGAAYCTHDGKTAEVAMWQEPDGKAIPFVEGYPSQTWDGWVTPDELITYAKFANEYASEVSHE